MQQRKLLIVLGILVLLSQGLPIIHANAAVVNETYTITPGVDYADYRFKVNSLEQAARVMSIDLNRPNLTIEPSVLSPVNKLGTTSARAKANTYAGHNVVGAINGSFFHTSSRMPAYLFAQNNLVSTLGVISTGSGEYMSVPSAFGITESGAPRIDVFRYDSYVEIEGVRRPISSINKERGAIETILYTPTWSYDSTRTNTYGMEIVVENVSKTLDTGFNFGETITGVVKEVTPYGRGGSYIPQDGYVLSIQGGEEAAKYASVKPGQSISLVINVEDKWKNAKSMLASGPMIVKDGKVDMTISQSSARAKERAPRTAVALDKTGKKVFFVTVDGRQTGYSRGMNLTEFAQYLVSIGADRAINLDGGGSTTMAVRKPGNIYATVVNMPSDKAERSVSTVLQAVNTAPYGEAKVFEFKKSSNDVVTVGSSITVQPDYALDENLTLLPFNTSLVQYSVEGGVGKMEGNTFIATKKGEGYIVGTYGSAVKKLPITVKDVVVNPKYTDVSAEHWAFKEINYLSDMKIITGYTNGQFKPEATLTRMHAAKLMASALNLPLETSSSVKFNDVPASHMYFKEISAIANAGVMTGKSDMIHFDPNGTLTRAQMAAILARAYKLEGIPEQTFSDVPLDFWAFNEIHALSANQIAMINEEKTFHPNNFVTRAQFSAFLYRIFTK
ncbi:phosphodiester glycosidase family protein [Peribacillus loiseleuriae]|uniref:phosphodiester glycosidase family protein n=1 Tax=Peribacillus loiseleuriae TaxID=1679170 RepID=UPI003CFBE0AB